MKTKINLSIRAVQIIYVLEELASYIIKIGYVNEKIASDEQIVGKLLILNLFTFLAIVLEESVLSESR